MTSSSLARALPARLAAFSVVAVVFCVVAGGVAPPGGWSGGPGEASLRVAFPVLYAWLVSVAVGAALGRRPRHAPLAGLLLLAGDVIAVGTLGCALHRGQPGESWWVSVLPFLAGYLVATLVAVMGRRPVAGVLGALAGTMVMGLGAGLLSILHRDAPDLGLLAAQFVLLATATIMTGFVTGWVEEEDQRRRMVERVERELQARDAEAGELVTFMQALATSGSLSEIAEAVVRHMRCHLGMQARAVAIEARGEAVAIWEEAGRLGPDHVERRRQRLQGSLARLGSNFVFPRLDARSGGTGMLPVAADYATTVEVPIQVGGRVGGVVLVADPARGAIPERRIGILADMVRRTGEAILRIERRSDEEQRRTALLLRQMREGVLLLGPDGQVLLMNPAAREVLRDPASPDAPPERIGEVAILELASTPPGVTRRFRAEVRPDGVHRPTLLACTAVAIMDGGKRIGTLATLSDVTEEELARGRLVASEKMTLVGQTLAGVAHELNNPLAALIGYADLLEVREMPAEVERPIRLMREQAMRAARIVRNLLNFAKQRNPERIPTRLADLVGAVVELFAYELRLANVGVTTEVPGDLPSVLADKHSLQQVLVNVVQNAIHALQDHPGERRIAIMARPLPDAIHLAIRDSGPGVPQDFRVRIFEPFFTTKGATRGTGLGLALSRNIAREHGGDLVLEPDDGKGACFSLRLPIPKSVPGEVVAGKDVPTLSHAGTPFHVLVVDDEQPVREALVAQLGRMGCRVDSASSALEAHRLAVKAEYDAILLDVRMPGGSGLDLHATLVRERPALAGRVVFMTGDFANEEVVAGMRATGCPWLEKPFTVEEMLGALSGRAGAPTVPAPRARSTMIGAA